MSRAMSYSMKKGPKKPRAPKPKAPKASKIRQKQKQSVNVKIHIDNSKKIRGRSRAPRHPSPFPQPISSYPIFRDEPPPPHIHYNLPPVAQPAVVAQGFHGIHAPVVEPEPALLRAAERVQELAAEPTAATPVVFRVRRPKVNAPTAPKKRRTNAEIAESRRGKILNPYTNKYVDPKKKAFQDLLRAGMVNKPPGDDGGGKMGPG